MGYMEVKAVGNQTIFLVAACLTAFVEENIVSEEYRRTQSQSWSKLRIIDACIKKRVIACNVCSWMRLYNEVDSEVLYREVVTVVMEVWWRI